MMLQRNLLYTAITRGKQLVVLLGDKKAIWTAINNERQETVIPPCRVTSGNERTDGL